MNWWPWARRSETITEPEPVRHERIANDQPFVQQGSGGRIVYGASLGQGGMSNAYTGQGTASDKLTGFQWTPTRVTTRQSLEVPYQESWLLRRVIDLLPMDMTSRWRVWTDDQPAMNEAMAAAEQKHMVRDRIRQALIASRLYGTACILVASTEAPLEEPLMLDSIREGDLRAFHVLNRFDLSVEAKVADLFAPDYGQPMMYRIASMTTDSRPVMVHASRMIRFDAGPTNFQSYDPDWAQSLLVAITPVALAEHQAAGAAAQIVSEGAMPVIKLENLRSVLAGKGESDDATPQQVAEMLNQSKSIYRTLFVDAADEVDRLPSGIPGVSDLMDKLGRRMAAASGVPYSRLYANDPPGRWGGTSGRGDADNFAETVLAEQERLLAGPLRVMDGVVARDAGLPVGEPLPYEWLPLHSATDGEQAQIAKVTAEALNLAVAGFGSLDEDEARTILSGRPIWGRLDGGAPGLPDDRTQPMNDEPRGSVPPPSEIPSEIPTGIFPPASERFGAIGA